MGNEIHDELVEEKLELSNKLNNLLQYTDGNGAYKHIGELIQIATRLKWLSKQLIELNKGSSAQVQELSQKKYEESTKTLKLLIENKERAEEIEQKRAAQEIVDGGIMLGFWFVIAIIFIIVLISYSCT